MLLRGLRKSSASGAIDQCTIVCDDDAIELYDTPLASPILNIEVNRKAKILRDPCTGCQLCVLACPTDAILMIDR